MKKLAAIAIVTSAFCMIGESSEGQIFRRFRDNVRGAISDSRQQYTPRPVQQAPQQRYLPQPSVQPQRQVQVQPQRQVQRVIVPNGTQRNATTQQLTPYARLSPAQRAAAPTTTGNAPSITAPRPFVPRGASPANVDTNGTKVRIVTYLDPRTGRTFQRRFIVPNDAPAPQNIQGQFAASGQPNVNQPNSLGVAPTGGAPQSASVIPPLNLAPVATPPVLNNSANESLPVLAGPTLDSTPQENAIPASLNDGSTVETASAEIPDLSGLSMENAESPAEPSLEGQDEFFSDPDLIEVDLDEVDDGSNVESYSVLETSDE